MAKLYRGPLAALLLALALGGPAAAQQITGIPNTGTVAIDQTTPGTTNGVQVNSALPAGTNVIGHVINDAGAAIVGKVGIDQTTPGTTNGVQVNAPLPAGTNVIGHVINDAGAAIVGKVGIDQTTPGTTNGVQVNAALPAGTNDIGKVDVQAGGGAAATGSGATNSNTIRTTLASDSAGIITTGSAGSPSSQVLTVQGVASMTPIATNPAAATTGGCTPGHTLSAASTNSTNVKASAGSLCVLSLVNTTGTLYFFKLYDKATAPTCNSDTVVFSVPVPASTTGAGAEIPLGPFGLAFTSGIGFCLTGALADNDNTSAATGIALSYAFK